MKRDDLTRTKYTTGQIAKLTGNDYRTIYAHYKKGLLQMQQDLETGRLWASSDQTFEYLVRRGYAQEEPEDSSSRKKAVLYARVSSQDQKKHGDLERQIGRMAMKLGRPFEVFSDVGSGLNASRKGLNQLMDLVIAGEVSEVYITTKDRLTRFGYEYLEKFFSSYGARIISLEEKPGMDVQEELAEDVMSLLASCSGKLYGLRRTERKKLADQASALLKGDHSDGKEDTDS